MYARARAHCSATMKKEGRPVHKTRRSHCLLPPMLSRDLPPEYDCPGGSVRQSWRSSAVSGSHVLQPRPSLRPLTRILQLYHAARACGGSSKDSVQFGPSQVCRHRRRLRRLCGSAAFIFIRRAKREQSGAGQGGAHCRRKSRENKVGFFGPSFPPHSPSEPHSCPA